ncbi:polyketide synthase [Yoonia sediminilitoris]|nr:polyketide synthase [Yoonia sediminilitoris]
MKIWLRNLTARVLVLLLTLAFATSGFAHRLASPQDAQLALAAAELGLSVSDICGDSGDEHATSSTCEVCLLTAASGLPPVSFALRALDTTTIGGLSDLRTSTVRSCADNTAHPVRAPPFV